MKERCVHFVGFKNEPTQRFWNAVRVFGLPDFWHVAWDTRAQREIADTDTVVFAKGESDQLVSPFTYDDSNDKNDPAYWERIR